MIDTSKLESDYRTMTARELAAAYGVSHAAMRQRLSRAFIQSPRRDAVRTRRSLLSRLWHRGTAVEIAEYMGLPIYTVRYDARRLGLPSEPWQTLSAQDRMVIDRLNERENIRQHEAA